MIARHVRWRAAAAALAVVLWAHQAAAQERERPRFNIQIERADLSFPELQRLVPALQLAASMGPLRERSGWRAARRAEGPGAAASMGPLRERSGWIVGCDRGSSRLQ